MCYIFDYNIFSDLDSYTLYALKQEVHSLRKTNMELKTYVKELEVKNQGKNHATFW